MILDSKSDFLHLQHIILSESLAGSIIRAPSIMQLLVFTVLVGGVGSRFFTFLTFSINFNCFSTNFFLQKFSLYLANFSIFDGAQLVNLSAGNASGCNVARFLALAPALVCTRLYKDAPMCTDCTQSKVYPKLPV